MTFRAKREWLEEAENLVLQMRANRERKLTRDGLDLHEVDFLLRYAKLLPASG